MARAEYTITESWVELAATGPSIFTVEKVGDGVLLFNDNASDVAAERFNLGSANRQFAQTVDKPMFVRSNGGIGWVVKGGAD